jgi:hypothetical protein
VTVLPYASMAVTVIVKGELAVWESILLMVKWSRLAGFTVRLVVYVACA